MNKKLIISGVVAIVGAVAYFQFGGTENSSVKNTETKEVVKVKLKLKPKPRVYTRTYPKQLSKVDRNQQIIDTIAESGVSDAVLDIIGEGEKKGYNDRMAGIKKLTRDINGTDKKALVDFLHTQYHDEIGMREIAFNAVKNDVLDVLLRQNELVDGLGQVLADMANDDSYGDMWQDYAVQFFASYYEQAFDKTMASKSTKEHKDDSYENSVPSVAREDMNQEQAAMLDTYWGFAEDSENPSAGTALIGLKYLSRNYSEIDQERIVKTAVDIVNDDSRPLGTKITALRMFDTKAGGMITDPEAKESAAEAARIIAQTGENTVLRMAAVATLGDLGSDDDVEFLQSMLESDDKNMRKVAQAALDKLQE